MVYISSQLNRRAFLTLAATAGLSFLAGCAQDAAQSGAGASSAAGAGDTGAGGATSAAGTGSASATAGAGAASGKPIVVGTLATEDLLPLWVAEEEGLCDAVGLGLEIVSFQSATELIAGVGSGEVDLAMTDIMVSASMFAGGIGLSLAWVTLGATPDQGRFGIMAGPESPIKTIGDLAGVPVGVGSNTILEYVMDKLMEDAGIPADQILVEELQKLPVRYQAMLSGEVAAAALPGSLLALGEAQGCRLIADDTQGANLSQSVMIARSAFLESAEGAQQLELCKQVWNEAVDLLNANPETYRATLIANTNLSDEIAQSYPVSTYPTAQLPSADMVEPVLEWMSEKGYLANPLSYDETTGAFAQA